MKRIVCLIVGAALALSLSACSAEKVSTAKSDELKAQYSFYEKSVKEIRGKMNVTPEQADEIFLVLVNNCGLDGAIRSIYTTDKGATYSYYWEGSAKTQKVTVENGVVTEVRYLYEVLYPIESPNIAETSSTESIRTYEFDTLQNIFNGFSDSTTMFDVESLISQNSLEFTVEDYRYCIAYTKGSALQRYADSGDYIEIAFDKSSGTILYAQYCTPKSYKSALFYNYGIWYSFYNDSPSEYTGYYSIAPLEKEDGIVIKYDNGNEAKTNYFKCDSAEEAIKAVIDSTITLKSELNQEPEKPSLESSGSSKTSTTESVAISKPETSEVESAQIESSSTVTTPPQSTSATTPSTPQPKPNVVYIAASGNGSKYHKSSKCSGMNGDVIEMTREEAEAAGYSPCKKNSCYG